MVEPVLAVAGVACTALVVLVVVVSVWAGRRERRRRERLQDWAARHGWTVTDRPAVAWATRLPGTNPHGVEVALSAIVHGRPVSVGEYTVTDTQISITTDATGIASSTTTTNTHHYVVTVVALRRVLPPTGVQARGTGSRLARAVLGPGETATGHRDFDRAFRIRTADPTTIGQWCTPALLAAHLTGQVPTWNVHGTELLSYRPGRLEPDRIPDHTAPVLYLADLLDYADSPQPVDDHPSDVAGHPRRPAGARRTEVGRGGALPGADAWSG